MKIIRDIIIEDISRISEYNQNKSYNNCQFSRKSFENLEDPAFNDCIFENCLFNQTNLEKISYSNSNNNLFIGCEFIQIRLKNTHFIGRIKECNFNQIIFDEEEVETNIIMKNLEVEDCIFEGIHFNNQFNFDGTNFFNCQFTNCSYKLSMIENIGMQNCILNSINFQGSSFDRVYFLNCNLEDSTFQDCDFDTETTIKTIFDNCNMIEANFSRTTISNVDFVECNLSHSNFNLSNFSSSNTKFRSCNVENAFFGSIDLRIIQIILLNPRLRNIGSININHDLEEDEMEEPLEQEVLDHLAIALEVHDAFKNIEIKKLFEFLQSIGAPNLSLDLANKDNFIRDLMNIMQEWISKRNFGSDSQKNLEYYMEKIDQLNLILENRAKYIELDIPIEEISISVGKLIKIILEFVNVQNIEFKQQYINSFIEDCFKAYSSTNNNPEENLSCVKGVFERFVFSLLNASITLCPNEDFTTCPSPYKELIQSIGSGISVYIDYDEERKKWFENEASKITESERKANYVTYMSNIYRIANLLNQSILDRINRDAEELELADLFKDEQIESYLSGGYFWISNKYFK